MNSSQRDPYRKWYILGLLVQVIAAWFSVGFHHPDEHFQVLEFCNYKLGYSAISDLPWEFAAKCRPGVLPLVAYILSRVLIFLHLFDPFAVAFLLRLLMGISTWLVSCQLIKLLIPSFATKQGAYMYVICSMLLWYVPYIGVRFSPEMVAGLLFFIGIILLLGIDDPAVKNKTLRSLLIGMLLGLSLFIRLQMAFAMFGVAVWMLLVRRFKWNEILLFVPGALVAIALCICIDRWLYDTWVFSPFNYYTVNITQNIAAKYGTSPWWDYIWLFFQKAIAPISAVLLVLFIVGIAKKPLHLLTIVCVFFIVGHSLIGHKELRFLFPIDMAFIYILCIGFDILIQRYTIDRIAINIFRLLAVMNVSLLLFKIFTPAQEAFEYYRYIYRTSQPNHTELMALDNSPYCLNNVEVNFFRPAGLKVETYIHMDSLIKAFSQHKRGTLLFSENILSATDQTRYNIHEVYCMFPDFILGHNFNHWEERSHIWAIYQSN